MQEFKLPRLFNWQLASQRIPYNIFSAKINLNIISTNSGLLVVGKKYFIEGVQPGDDFSNVGFPLGAVGGTFTATGTTPIDWTNGTTVTNMTDSQPVVNRLQDTIGITVALEYLSVGTNRPALSFTFRKTNGFPESKFWEVSAVIRVDDSLAAAAIQDIGFNQQYEFRVYNT